MDQLTELRPPDFTDVTKWWIFSNKSLLVCLGGGVIAYLLFKITAMIHLAFLGVWLSLIAHRLNRRTYYKDTEWEEEF